MSALMALLIGIAAHAGVVVTAVDAERAVELLGDLGDRGQQFVPVAELAAGPAAALGGGVATPCGEGPLAEGLVARIRGSLLYMDHVDVAAAAEDLPRAAACLSAPVEASLSAAWVHVGLAALRQGDEEGARRAMASALNLDPAHAWDQRLGLDGLPLLDEVRATASTGFIEVHAPGWEVLVDGRAPEGAVRPGHHLVQWRGPDGAWAGLSVELHDGEAVTVVVPGAFAREVWTDPARHAALSALLDASLGYGVSALVVTEGATWRVEAGAWSEVPRSSRSGPGPRAVALGGGGAVAAGGVALVVVGRERFTSANADRCAASTPGDWDEADGRMDRARALYTAGWVVTGAGVGGLVAGVLLPGPVSLGPLPVVGGAGLVVGVRR